MSERTKCPLIDQCEEVMSKTNAELFCYGRRKAYECCVTYLEHVGEYDDRELRASNWVKEIDEEEQE